MPGHTPKERKKKIPKGRKVFGIGKTKGERFTGKDPESEALRERGRQAEQKESRRTNEEKKKSISEGRRQRRDLRVKTERAELGSRARRAGTLSTPELPQPNLGQAGQPGGIPPLNQTQPNLGQAGAPGGIPPLTEEESLGERLGQAILDPIPGVQNLAFPGLGGLGGVAAGARGLAGAEGTLLQGGKFAGREAKRLDKLLKKASAKVDVVAEVFKVKGLRSAKTAKIAASRAAELGVINRFVTNEKSISLTNKILIAMGVSGTLLTIIGTYPFAGFIKEEALQTLSFAAKTAQANSDAEGFRIALEETERLLDPTAWNKLINTIPFVNDANFWITAEKSFLQSSSSVNFRFEKSLVVGNSPLVVDNKGLFTTRSEGSIEFWVSPKFDTIKEV